MKTLLKHLGTGLALCVGTCMLGNLPVEANTPGGRLANQGLPEQPLCPKRASRLDCRRTLHGDVRLGDAQR